MLTRIIGYKDLTKIDIIAVFDSLRISPENKALIIFVINIKAYIYKIIFFSLITGLNIRPKPPEYCWRE